MSAQKKVVFIAGPVTGQPLYNQPAFDRAAKVIEENGDIGLNPRSLPLGMSYDAYMTITTAMVRTAQLVVMLPGWENSNGAREEQELAWELGIPVLDFDTYNIGKHQHYKCECGYHFDPKSGQTSCPNCQTDNPAVLYTYTPDHIEVEEGGNE